MSCRERGPKVKIITTQFVQTDATQFKSVVQSLTGKNAKVGQSNGAKKAVEERPPPPCVVVEGPWLGDFEKFFMEMPPMEEFNSLRTFN
ncbi:hypothetical protein QJS04_geneDACA011026 [Acorus gramineus]|uniref:VQ domain-containing protein n=1 Tax=Acorus gramineus TaxID=55184 RepID=A0AAV9BHC1_ACOGR|nr:hypothetical protein QJS04_geneDACA011026 [Acorus gramineus]